MDMFVYHKLQLIDVEEIRTQMAFIEHRRKEGKLTYHQAYVQLQEQLDLFCKFREYSYSTAKTIAADTMGGDLE